MQFSAEQITKIIREQIKNYENRLVTDEVTCHSFKNNVYWFGYSFYIYTLIGREKAF